MINITPATMFSMMVSIAKPILNDTHHMIIAVSNPMTWNIARISNTMRNVKMMFPVNLDMLCVYTSFCKELFSILCLTLFTINLLIRKIAKNMPIARNVLSSMLSRFLISDCMISGTIACNIFS